MGWEFINSKMGITTTAIGNSTGKMVREFFITLKLEVNTMVNGWRIKNMDKGSSPTQTKITTKVNGKRTKSQGMGFSSSRLKTQPTMENGRTIWPMEKEP